MSARLRARRIDGRGVRRWARWVLPVFGAAAVIGLLVSAGLGLGVRDAGCTAVCHAMRPYADASDVSPHGQLRCAACHAGEGPLSIIADGLAIQRRAGAALRGAEPSLAPSADDACLTCHAGVLRGVMTARGIAVRHQDFLGMPCAECHGGTGHEVADRVYAVPEMDDCMQCHSSSSREPTTCGRCHVPVKDAERRVRKSTWRTTHGPDWKTAHGLGDQSACVSCHRPAYCAKCHGVALPHPESWPREHGETATSEVLGRCRTCHESQWCSDCHGVEMPHPADFLPTHGPRALETGEQLCERCHAAEACSDCHLRSSHPDTPGADGMRIPGGGR